MFNMIRVRKLTIAALTALTLTAGAVAATPSTQLTGVHSQGLIQSVARKGSFDITEVARKVNEYEGQHRIAKKGSFDITEVAKVNEYEGQHRVG